MGLAYPPLEDRPLKNIICLFDVDNTLTLARKVSQCSLIFGHELYILMYCPWDP